MNAIVDRDVELGAAIEDPAPEVIDSAAGFVIGIDIASTRLRVAAVDIYGEKLRELELETATGGSRAARPRSSSTRSAPASAWAS
jgi:hypothetical protein